MGMVGMQGWVQRFKEVFRGGPRGGAFKDLQRSLTHQDAQIWHQVLDSAPIGVGVVDSEGRMVLHNQALGSLLNNSQPIPEGTIIWSLFPEGQQGVIQKFLNQVHTPKPQMLEVRGPNRTFSLYLSTFAYTQTPLFVVHCIDITEGKSLEAQFVQSQKMQAVGLLAGGVAHDFNNLLTAMLGFCDFVLSRHSPGEQTFSDVMQIRQNAQRAANLVRQLLAFSRQQNMQPRVLDVTEILGELSSLLRRLIGPKIELQIAHARNLPPIRADLGQLEQVLINLVVNARDAMGERGKLTIATLNYEAKKDEAFGNEILTAGRYVRIDVTDSGTGIRPEDLERIFEPFFSTKKEGAGTGLGLSTVYGIVKQTGGVIAVKTALGVGSTFSIFLPAYAKEHGVEEAVEVRKGEHKDLSGSGCILLVEDEEPVRLFTARALRSKGYDVLEAGDGLQALELIQEGQVQPDLIVTDVVMPKLDGPEFVAQAKLACPDIRVIFISGYSEDAFRQKLDHDQNVQFLPKPYTLKQLAEKVQEVMLRT